MSNSKTYWQTKDITSMPLTDSGEHIVLLELHSAGKDFKVTVVGPADGTKSEFVNALAASASALCIAFGGTALPGTNALPTPSDKVN